MAMSGYSELLREFPTWWLPTLKTAVVAKALGQSTESVLARIGLARNLSPSGTYLPLVESLLLSGVPRDPSRVEGAAPSLPDPLADRMALLRAGRLAAEGRRDESEAEYRSILARNPGVLVARWKLARILVESGRTGEAAAFLHEGAGRSAFSARWRSEALSQEHSNRDDTGTK